MSVKENTRDEKVRIIENYFKCVVEGRLEDLPITHDYGSESPLSGLLTGVNAIKYLGIIGAEMSNIQILQNIVEGDFVAVYFEETTQKGILPVVGLFEFKGDKIRFVRVFFDSAHPSA